ncbi:FMP32-like protein [Elsinoe fawcettii]|nr:FMP32-like protein [Elsinoe fawcettii]
MANTKAVEALPRFLLPRLSWIPLRTSEATRREIQRFAIQPSRAHVQCLSAVAVNRTSGIRDSRRTIDKTGARQDRKAAWQQRWFSASARRTRDHHFDTLKFVERLQEEGFSEEQSVALMKILGEVVEESISNLTRTMVPREEQEKATYTQKVDFAKLRSELLSADSTESGLTRASHERLTNDLTKLNSRLRDEIQRTQASVRLDLNLEKGRIREEANSQDLKIKEVETRIEQETAALRERLEQVKFSTLQWLMGVCTGTAAIILGVWRLLM